MAPWSVSVRLALSTSTSALISQAVQINSLSHKIFITDQIQIPFEGNSELGSFHFERISSNSLCAKSLKESTQLAEKISVWRISALLESVPNFLLESVPNFLPESVSNFLLESFPNFLLESFPNFSLSLVYPKSSHLRQSFSADENLSWTNRDCSL